MMLRVFRRSVQALMMITQAAVPFVAYGSLDWIMAWAYSAVIVGTVIALVLVLGTALRKNHVDQQHMMGGWSTLGNNFLYIIIQLPVLLVAGLSLRFGWSPHVPIWIQVAALLVAIVGLSLFFWAL